MNYQQSQIPQRHRTQDATTAGVSGNRINLDRPRKETSRNYVSNMLMESGRKE